MCNCAEKKRWKVLLPSVHQHFEFQIFSFKFAITIQLCCVHIYCENNRRFAILIFQIAEIKTFSYNWSRKLVFKLKYSQRFTYSGF